MTTTTRKRPDGIDQISVGGLGDRLDRPAGRCGVHAVRLRGVTATGRFLDADTEIRGHVHVYLTGQMSYFDIANAVAVVGRDEIERLTDAAAEAVRAHAHATIELQAGIRVAEDDVLEMWMREVANYHEDGPDAVREALTDAVVDMLQEAADEAKRRPAPPAPPRPRSRVKTLAEFLQADEATPPTPAAPRTPAARRTPARPRRGVKR